MLLLIGLLLLLLKLLSYRCGDYLICEGAIEGVVEMSIFSCYFQSCLLAAIFFPVKLYIGPEVVVWSCGVIL